MSQTGDDVRLSRMLLEVALDLDAEADAIEAEAAAETHLRRIGIEEALIQINGTDGETIPVQIVGISVDGARLRTDRPPQGGSAVTLSIQAFGLALNATTTRVRGTHVFVAFEPAARADPALIRLLRQQPPSPEGLASERPRGGQPRKALAETPPRR